MKKNIIVCKCQCFNTSEKYLPDLPVLYIKSAIIWKFLSPTRNSLDRKILDEGEKGHESMMK